MPQAVFHILTGLIVSDVIRDFLFKKKNFPLYLVLVCGIAALLPDVDVFIWWLASLFFNANYLDFHRTFTHSIFFILVFLIPALIFYSRPKISKFFLMAALGVSLHLILDATFQGYIMPLYPFSVAKFGLNLFGNAFAGTIVQGVDAILLVLWLIYIDLRHKISDFI